MSLFADLAAVGGPRQTPQSEPIPGTVPNHAGGYSFEASLWARLLRFLVLGTDGGTYYVGAAELTAENAAVVRECLDTDAERTVNMIVGVSHSGRATKNDPAIFALAMAAGHPEGRRFVTGPALTAVCRTGTHLFHFAAFVEKQRGWGRGLRRAVAHWYTSRTPGQLALQLVKYRQRDGWSHLDLLRLAHPQPPTVEHDALFGWLAGKVAEPSFDSSVRADDGGSALKLIHAFEFVQGPDVGTDAKLQTVSTYGLPWETLPSEMLTEARTWETLIDAHALPLGATIRNLGVMTARGISSKHVDLVANVLVDGEALRRARIHPYNVLNALVTYRNGSSRGGVQWQPHSIILDALDRAFTLSFGNVESSGKRLMLALDISGSMDASCSGAAFTCAEGSAAMALVSVVAEQHRPVTVAFDTAGRQRGYQRQSGIVPVDISPRRRLDDIVRSRRWNGGGTDCALPMLHALANGLAVDAFVVYTDNETWHGEIHPMQALQRYRERTGIPAKLVVVSMTANRFSIADPSDSGALDVVGFDPATPGTISDFAAGRF